MSTRQPHLPTLAPDPEGSTVQELIYKEVMANRQTWDLTTMAGREKAARDHAFYLLYAAQPQQPNIFGRYYGSQACMDAVRYRQEMYAAGDEKAHTAACRALWAVVEALIREGQEDE